jgi:hypothetical protein
MVQTEEEFLNRDRLAEKRDLDTQEESDIAIDDEIECEKDDEAEKDVNEPEEPPMKTNLAIQKMVESKE